MSIIRFCKALNIHTKIKLSSGTVCLLGFSCRAGHIRKGKYKICGSYQVQNCTGRNGIVHHARRMTRCSNITSLGQMALESTICGIVHHARRGFGMRELGFGVRDAQCHRWYSLVPSVPNSLNNFYFISFKNWYGSPLAPTIPNSFCLL